MRIMSLAHLGKKMDILFVGSSLVDLHIAKSGQRLVCNQQITHTIALMVVIFSLGLAWGNWKGNLSSPQSTHMGAHHSRSPDVTGHRVVGKREAGLPCAREIES